RDAPIGNLRTAPALRHVPTRSGFAKKTPPTRGRGRAAPCGRAVELVVRADADGVVSGTRARIGQGEATAQHRKRGVDELVQGAEIEVQIFELGGPVAEDAAFDAGAGGPANLRG